MADNTIDTLNIQIGSSTTQAVRSINNLVKKLDTLNTALGNLDISRLNNFSNSLKSLGSVNFKANGLNAAINAINRLGKSDFSQFDTGKLGEILTEMQKLDAIPDVSPSVSRFTTAIAKLAGTGQYIGNVSKELPNLATGLNNAATKLGSMSEVSASTNAFITSLGKLASAGDKTGKTASQLSTLAQEVLKFFNAMKSAPDISLSTIRMTEALAVLASSGSKVGRATNSVSNSFNTLSSLGSKASTVIHGLTNAFQKFASKAISLGGKAISAIAGIGNASSEAGEKIRRLSNPLSSVTNKLSALYAKGFLAKRALDVLTSPVESAMNYVETLNYFNSAFNQVAEGIDTDEWKKSGIKSAEAYANSFQERAKQLSQKLTGFEISDTGELTRTNTASLGLDPEKTMQYQATFAQMASSMGDTSETALKLSNALTMIGADLASVRNMDFEDVWQDMASGLTGMSRAMDKYGINIRNANMQQELYNLGINTSISNLSQADKTILRTIILLNNSKYAWADLSNTINQPANQIRMLQSNFASLGRTIGSLFIPILQTVLPYINAIVIAIQRMFAWIAKLLGIKLSNFVSSTGGISVDTSNIADNMDNANDAIDNANTSAKKLEKTLSVLSFDELNQLNDNSDSGSTSNPSSGSGGGASHLPALDAALDDALSAYQKAWDEAFKKMSNRANEMADAIVNAFKRKDWKGLGKIMADGINWGMQKLYDFINWNNVGPYITKFTSAFTQTFNSLVDNINWDLMGRTVGAGINTIVNTANQLLEGTNFKNLGKKFAEGIMGLSREVDWTNLGNLIGNNFMKSWHIFYGFVSNIKYDEIGINIGNALNGVFEKINFTEIASALTTGINGAFTALASFTATFNWDDFTKNLGDGISKFISDMHWKENGKALGDFLSHLCDALTDALTPNTFRKLGEGIGDFIGQLPWGKLLATAAKLLISGFGDAMSGLWKSGLSGKITAGLTTAFVAVKIADITGIGTLVGKLIGHIGDKIMAKESADIIAEKLSSILGQGTSEATQVLDGLGEAAGTSGGKFASLAKELGPLVGTAGLIVGVGAAAVYATSKIAGMVESMQGGNGVGTTFGNTMDNFIQTLQQRGDIISGSATEIWNLKESLEKEGMTAEEQSAATQKIIDKLGEMGVTSDQAEQAFSSLYQQGLITDDMFDILSESIKTLSDKSTNMAGSLNLSKYSVDELAEVLPKLTTQLGLNSDQQTQLNTALYDMPNASGTAQGAYENIMATAKEMGLNTESVAKIFAETFPDAVQTAKESVSKQTSEIRWNTTRDFNDAAGAVTKATGQMKSTAMSDYEAIHSKATESSQGVTTATATQWGSSAKEVSKNLDSMKQAANLKLGEMQKTVESHFSSQYNTMTKKWEKAAERITGRGQIIDTLDSVLSRKVPAMSKYFTQLANNISKSLNGLYNVGRNAAQELSNGLQSVHIKTPHIYMNSSASASGNSMSYRWDSGVNWYAKGGLFKNASVIGVGEAGQEAVLPLENRKAMKSIADSIMSGYDGNMGLTKDEIMEAVERGVVTALMNNGGFGGSSPEYIMNSIKVNERELARIVTKAQNNTDYRMNPSPVY
nr:MAG TPA: minor tail protein [Caudoviricetes sp.]